MAYDFITIGGTTRDISFFTDQGVIIKNHKDILRQKVLAFESGAKIKVDHFYYSYGGGAANAAVCLANFGFKAACLATVGDDEDGALIIENLRRHRVDVRLMERISKMESGSSFILIAPDGERIIFAQRGANTHLTINQARLSLLKKTKNIYIASLSGNWLVNLQKIFLVAGQGGQKVFWNPGTTQLLGGVDKIAPFMKKTTVFTLNQDEAIELVVRSKQYGHLRPDFLNQTENLLKLLQGLGPQIVVITLGHDGVAAFDGHRIYRRSALKDKKRVDTTGVGDVFNATFAAGLNLTLGNIDKAIHLALQNTAAKVGHIGAQTGLIKI
jgi:ribokinase